MSFYPVALNIDGVAVEAGQVQIRQKGICGRFSIQSKAQSPCNLIQVHSSSPIDKLFAMHLHSNIQAILALDIWFLQSICELYIEKHLLCNISYSSIKLVILPQGLRMVWSD